MKSKRNKIIVILTILFISFLVLYFGYLRFNIVRTEHRIMYGEEVMERKAQIKQLIDNGYKDEMLAIYFEYSKITDKMVPIEGKVYFDYAIVQQKYKIDRKFGWMPVGIPKIQILEKER